MAVRIDRGQRQQGHQVAFGDVIFPPALVLGFPPTVLHQ